MSESSSVYNGVLQTVTDNLWCVYIIKWIYATGQFNRYSVKVDQTNGMSPDLTRTTSIVLMVQNGHQFPLIFLWFSSNSNSNL